MGYTITLATGRIHSSVGYAIEYFDFVNYVITDTGAFCYDAYDSYSIFNHTIDLEIAEKITKFYDENCEFIEINTKNMIYKYSDLEENNEFMMTVKDWDYIFNNYSKITPISLSMKTNDQLMAVYEKMKKELPELDIHIIQDSFANKKWLKIIKKGYNKYTAVCELAKFINVKNQEIIAFGDGLSDIDMLKNCGVGGAVSHALPNVKENAQYVTTYDHNHDGVIEFLKTYLNVS